MSDGMMRSGGDGSDGSDGSDEGGENIGCIPTNFNPSVMGSSCISISLGGITWTCNATIACFATIRRKVGATLTDLDTYEISTQGATAAISFVANNSEINGNDGKTIYLYGNNISGSYYSPSGNTSVNFGKLNFCVSRWKINEETNQLECIGSDSFERNVEISAQLEYNIITLTLSIISINIGITE